MATMAVSGFGVQTRLACSPSLRPAASRSSFRVRAAAEGPAAAKPVRPVAPEAPQQATSSSSVATATTPAVGSTVSLEFQRQRAKDMVAYFQDKKFEDISKRGQVFGWTRQNEVGNGRWVMFGLLVGLLTEYATGVNFPNQIALVLENLGIID